MSARRRRNVQRFLISPTNFPPRPPASPRPELVEWPALSSTLRLRPEGSLSNGPALSLSKGHRRKFAQSATAYAESADLARAIGSTFKTRTRRQLLIN